MEITNSLLVAMMFIVLLTIGIGNIIMTLAIMVDRRSALRFDAIHTSWMILLLLVYFRLFWQVLDILSIENWSFWGFLFILGGPLILLFATNMIVQDKGSELASEPRGHYYAVARQFFFFIALQQAWAIGVDILFGDGITLMSGVNIVAGLLFLIMASSPTERVHSFGTVVAWLLILGAVVLQGAGVGS